MSFRRVPFKGFCSEVGFGCILIIGRGIFDRNMGIVMSCPKTVSPDGNTLNPKP